MSKRKRMFWKKHMHKLSLCCCSTIYETGGKIFCNICGAENPLFLTRSKNKFGSYFCFILGYRGDVTFEVRHRMIKSCKKKLDREVGKEFEWREMGWDDINLGAYLIHRSLDLTKMSYVAVQPEDETALTIMNAYLEELEFYDFCGVDDWKMECAIRRELKRTLPYVHWELKDKQSISTLVEEGA